MISHLRRAVTQASIVVPLASIVLVAIAAFALETGSHLQFAIVPSIAYFAVAQIGAYH